MSNSTLYTDKGILRNEYEMILDLPAAIVIIKC